MLSIAMDMAETLADSEAHDCNDNTVLVEILKPADSDSYEAQQVRLEVRAVVGAAFFGGSSFNDGTTQTALDPPGRGAGSHPGRGS
jgi:hypothetical protein